MNIKLTAKELKTINYYDTHAFERVKKHGSDERFKEDRKKIIDLAPSGKIIEIGVGIGPDAPELIRHFGLENYIGVEPAEGLIRIVKEKIPGIKILKTNIFDMEFPSNSFDVFWACAVLIHIPKNKLQKAFNKIKSCVKKGSFGFISIMEGNLNMEESRPGRYYSLWGQEEFESELSKAGFSVYRKRRIVPENGSPWLAYIVKIYE